MSSKHAEIKISVQKCSKELGALRGYFGLPVRPKNEIRFSLNSSY